MADVLIQFHALPQELLSFAQQWIADFKLNVIALKPLPFELIEVEIDKLPDVCAEQSPYRKLLFSVNKPMLPASNLDYLKKNPNVLTLGIERKTSEGLRQTAIMARTADIASLSIWRAIANRLRKATHAGVKVINPDTGATGFESIFRYTDGAKKMANDGIPMLPFAGGNRIIFI